MRRSGAVEGDAGVGSVEDQADKMANTVHRNKQLRNTYDPANVASVHRLDEANEGRPKVSQRRPCDTHQ